ncbi:MAG: substrate-binding domain-containing protein [Ignavibacteriales bacterium]|nr:substrate-binding domain-containing protein [Ignavibacteriales bacterium]
MKNNTKKIIALIFLITFACSANISAQVIIVNRSNPISNLSKAMVRNIFLGNTSTWSSNSLIKVADYTAESKVRSDFSSMFLNLSPIKVSMLWIKVSLSGKSKPPKIFRDEEELKQYISENEDAIGYITQSSGLSSNLKIVSITQ